MGDKFKPDEHLEKIKGKDYLNAQWRLVWFRDAEPEGQITTHVLEHVPGDYALVKATVARAGGGVGTGHKLVTAKQFGDYLAKAETQAIARALAAVGFGTQFAVELADEDVDQPEPSRVADSAVSPPRTAQTPAPAPKAAQRGPQAPQSGETKTWDKDSFLAWMTANNIPPGDVYKALGKDSTAAWLKAAEGRTWTDLKNVVHQAIFGALPELEEVPA